MVWWADTGTFTPQTSDATEIWRLLTLETAPWEAAALDRFERIVDKRTTLQHVSAHVLGDLYGVDPEALAQHVPSVAQRCVCVSLRIDSMLDPSVVLVVLMGLQGCVHVEPIG